MRALAVAVALAGCGFSASTGSGDDEPTCGFVAGSYIDPCTVTPPAGTTLSDLTITGATRIDTNTGELQGPNVIVTPSAIVDGVLVVWVESLTIQDTGTLRAVGDSPLAIIATGTIRIDGVLDATSTKLSKGAGANPAACNDTSLVAAAGQQCANHGGSGGGGGGFGAAGGPGGSGGVGHTCDGMNGKPGGVGGKAVSGKPPALRGGCRGGNGATSDNTGSLPGIAGDGGGAIALIAAMKIVVGPTGRITAGGGGGQPGAERAGGGGGGSGGMIFLESVEVDLQPLSVVAANGGGGAGGCDGNNATAGEDGRPGTDDADGGDKEGNGGDGGDGGAAEVEMQTLAGRLGMTAERGGGGGGGGVGMIRVHQKTGSLSGIASPPIAQE